MTDLKSFGPAGSFEHGSAADQVRNLLNLRHKQGADAPATVDATAPQSFAATADQGGAVVADAPVGGNAAVPTEVAAPVEVPPAGAVDTDAIRAAANQAANDALADPTYQAGARQVPEIHIQPELIVQGQAGPIDVPVRIAVPASHPNFTIAAPTVTVVDPATGQAISSSAAAAAGGATGEVAAEAPQGFRGMTAEQIGAIFGRKGGGQAVQEQVAAATGKRGAGLLEQIRAAAAAATGGVVREGGVVSETPVAETGAAAAKAGDRLLAQARGVFGNLGAMRGPAAEVQGQVAEVAEKAAADGLGDKAVAALRLAMKARG